MQSLDPDCEIYVSPNGKLFGIFTGKLFNSWIVQPDRPDAVRELPKKLVAVDNTGHYAIVEHNRLLYSFALIETHTGKQRAILTPRGKSTYWAFSPDSKTIASGGEDGAVSLWNVATGQAMLQLPTHSSHVLAVQFSSDSRALAAIVADRVIKADGLETGSVRVFVWAGQRQAD
jgi:WD40 repeat protein